MPDPLSDREAAEEFAAAQRACEEAKSMGDLQAATLGAAAICLATDLPARLLAKCDECERLKAEIAALENQLDFYEVD